MALKILICDDDPVVRMLAEEYLSRAGCGVETVECGQDCLNRLSQGNLPNALFLDLILPDMTGVEILRKIREDPALSALHVVMLSADTEALTILKEHDLKAEGMLQKPFKMPQIEEVLASVPAS